MAGTRSISSWLPIPVFEELTNLCNDRGMSKSSAIREAVEFWLENKAPPESGLLRELRYATEVAAASRQYIGSAIAEWKNQPENWELLEDIIKAAEKYNYELPKEVRDAIGG